MYKESNYLLFERGDYIYSRGHVYCLLFGPNIPEAMFIQWGKNIPDSRLFSIGIPGT